MQPHHSDADVLELYVTGAPPGDGDLLLRMSPQIADEVRTLLDKSGLPHSRGAEFASGPELVIEAVTVLSAAGGLAALASVINAVIRRHDGKRVVIERNGEKFEAAGYSEQAVERLVKERAREQAELEAEWEAHQGDD